MRISAIFLGVFLFSCGEVPQSQNHIPSVAAQRIEEPPMEVTATKYHTEYESNEVSADELYKDKRISITGIVESVNKNEYDQVYVMLVAGDGFNFGVRCELANQEEGKKVKKGDKATLVGTGKGMDFTWPTVANCVVK